MARRGSTTGHYGADRATNATLFRASQADELSDEMVPTPSYCPLVKSALPTLNLLGAAIFAVFAWLQREDDNAAIYTDASKFDAYLWIGFYALIAALFVLAIFRKFPWPLYLITVVFCLYQMIVTGPGLWENLFGEKEATLLKNSMNPSDPRVELSREFFGALIALVATGLIWIQRRGHSRSV